MLVGAGLLSSDGCLHSAQLSIAIHDVIQRRTATARAFLSYMCKHVIRVQSKLAIICLKLAEQHREQGRLAAAVGADQAHSLPGVELETDVLDKQIPPAADTYIIEA